jgi:hypothetical protein
LVGGFLVLHGLVTSAIGFGTVNQPTGAPMAMPSWLAWWPTQLGRSWVFDALGLGRRAAIVGGLTWLVAGLALIAGALGWLGVGPLAELCEPLLVGGAVVGLVAMALYFHPLYLGAVLINLAMVWLLWGRLAATS